MNATALSPTSTLARAALFTLSSLCLVAACAFGLPPPPGPCPVAGLHG